MCAHMVKKIGDADGSVREMKGEGGEKEGGMGEERREVGEGERGMSFLV